MSIIKGTDTIVAGFGGTKRSIGEVYFSQSALATDNSGALPLFTGETIASANTIYPEFYNWVLAHTELQCTSAEYESALTTYGECAKYVIGSGSLRLPLIKNYIKAANPSEGIKNIEAGLPNHTHNIVGSANYNGTRNNAFGNGTSNPATLTNLISPASESNPIYGKSSTVTPASTTLYPWVVAYAAAVPASTAQAAEFQQGLSGKADTNLGNIPSNYDYVVESYNDGTNWYRVYKSGWIEQGGYSAPGILITLLKPFSNANYNVQATPLGPANGATTIAIYDKTVTGFYFTTASNATAAYWRAEGQGA